MENKDIVVIEDCFKTIGEAIDKLVTHTNDLETSDFKSVLSIHLQRFTCDFSDLNGNVKPLIDDKLLELGVLSRDDFEWEYRLYFQMNNFGFSLLSIFETKEEMDQLLDNNEFERYGEMVSYQSNPELFRIHEVKNRIK